MKSIKELELRGKKVIVRCDFNVPMADGKVRDDSKIKMALPTINYLQEQGATIILLSHLGRVKTEEDKVKNSLKPVAQVLANLLGQDVKFINHCYGTKVKEYVANLAEGDIVLLENTRWLDVPDKCESGNDERLAQFWATLANVYVNDAFGSCHRAHASTAGIAKYLPHGVGFLVEKELKELDILRHDTPHPFTVFMGGAKVDDKLPLIKAILPKCDFLLTGGGIANSFLKAQGSDVGSSIVASDPVIIQELQELLKQYGDKIKLPTDFVTEDGAIYDLGPESLKNYEKFIASSAIVFVNGTCGKYEDVKFSQGTKTLLEMLARSPKKVIIGGGDTVSAVKKLGYADAFSFLSTGGGATLEYLADGKLAALEWMN